MFSDLGVIYCLLSSDREESRQEITRLINSYMAVTVLYVLYESGSVTCYVHLGLYMCWKLF